MMTILDDPLQFNTMQKIPRLYVKTSPYLEVVSYQFSLVWLIIASVNTQWTSAESIPKCDLIDARCRNHVTNDSTAKTASSKCVSVKESSAQIEEQHGSLNAKFAYNII